MHSSGADQTIAVALAAGIFAQCVARHLRIPGIVLLLALGTVVGTAGLGWVRPDSLGDFLWWMVDFAVAVILFEGGLNLLVSRLRREEVSIRRLVTVGALMTLGLTAVAVQSLLGWPWEICFLFGSLVVVTGPTVVTPLLRDLRLKPSVKTVLEAEGVLIDPVGAILAVLVLQVALPASGEKMTVALMDVALRLGFGIVGGAAAGFLLGGLLRLRAVVPNGYENIFVLAAVILTFYGCNQVVSHSGVLAVTLAGVVVGNMSTRVERDLREFKDQITLLLVGLLFVLLAAGIRPDDVIALGWPGAAVVAVLVLAIRPLNVLFSTWGSGLPWREKAFIAWIAPRGIVAAAVTSLTVGEMKKAGLAGGDELQALVFLTIAATVVLAGFTARPLAMLLRVRLPRRDRVAILGAQGIGLALGAELRDAGVAVVFLDSDPERCRRAQEEGFPVVFGDALEERTLLRSQIELVGTAIGLTPNEHLNSLFVGHAREVGGVPKAFVALTSLDSSETPDYVKRVGAEVLFDGPRDIARWDVRSRHGDLLVEYLEHHPPDAEREEAGADASLPAGGMGRRYVLLAVKRGDSITPMYRGFEPKEGDIASVAVYKPERGRALEVLAALGWKEIGVPEASTAVDA